MWPVTELLSRIVYGATPVSPVSPHTAIALIAIASAFERETPWRDALAKLITSATVKDDGSIEVNIPDNSDTYKQLYKDTEAKDKAELEEFFRKTHDGKKEFEDVLKKYDITMRIENNTINFSPPTDKSSDNMMSLVSKDSITKAQTMFTIYQDDIEEAVIKRLDFLSVSPDTAGSRSDS